MGERTRGWWRMNDRWMGMGMGSRRGWMIPFIRSGRTATAENAVYLKSYVMRWIYRLSEISRDELFFC